MMVASDGARERAMMKRRKTAPKAPKPISEDPIVFGRVIAERKYRVGTRRIVVQVGTPHRASWKTDWYCPFRSDGLQPGSGHFFPSQKI
jgi:hypothetical protein